MEPSCDFIENLLKTTGLSADDLLVKLQQYKTVKTNKFGEDVDAFESESEKDGEQGTSNNSVILASQSSNVDFENVNNNNEETEAITETQATKEVEPDKISPEKDETYPVGDHDYSNATANGETSVPSSDNPEPPSDTDDLPKSEDNLRNIIRMQLSSLRNMKKSSGLVPDLEKKSIFFHNLKKKRKSCDLNPKSQSSDKEENSFDENPLVSMSDDTNFMIVNVAGGVDIPDPVPPVTSDIPCENKKNDTDTASPKKQIKNILTNYRKKMSLNYFDKNRYNLVPNKSNSLMVKKNIADNFDQDPGCNKSVKNSEKSPFVSVSLEDFLNESSQLKISYAIPKLGAEEGLMENTKKSPYDNLGYKAPKVETNPEPDKSTPKDKPKVVKPKTLAEMRRQFEKMKAKEKPNPEVAVKKEETDIQSNHVLYTPRERNCFVLYNNEKLLASGQIKDKCVAVINAGPETPSEKTPPKATDAVNKKPSLLSSLTQGKPRKVNYKPGPLCKKVDLQNAESRDLWKSELKDLPKVYLEVVPQVNHPIDPKLVHLLPVFDETVISEERTNFALSVLPRSEPKPFTFHIPYNNNQEKMLVRQLFTPTEPKPEPEKIEESDPTKDIASILDGIINYVEVKEIEDTLIKEDETTIEESNDSVTTKTKGRKTKRKKLELEMLRLSCKVIDVATSETSDKDCPKPHCRLGCVCKSLLCESVFSNHCQIVECMFGCKCPPVVSEDNALPAHTVSHLEDKAKKNLARVEREFTQTLIHTDNDMILVGSGKVRRSSKPPKKYDDYIANDEIFDNEKNVPSLKILDIPVEKLDLTLLKTFCMMHYAHDCTCKWENADYVPPKKISKFEVKKVKAGDQIPKIRIVKTKEDQHKAWYDSCARIRTVFPEYKMRNKTPVYNEKLRKKVDSKSRYMTKDPVAILPKPESGPVLKKPSKRKQSFTIREDVPYDHTKEFALQRRKKKVKPGTVSNTSVSNPIFEGEIKVSLKDNKDILNIIGQENASLEYLRILPWSKLIENFRARKLSIWSREKKSSGMLLCNAAGYFPPKHFVDIRQIQQRTEIMKWILTDTLPPDYPRKLMHLILTPKKCNFLIAGYCLKKLTDKKEPDQSDKKDPLELFNLDQNEPCASPKSSESRSSFEDVSVGSPEPLEEEENESVPVLKPAQSRSNEISQNVKQQSVLIRKLLNTEPLESPTKKLLIERTFEKINSDLLTKQKPVKTKPGVRQIEVLKSSQKSVMLATICKQMQSNTNVKLQSILNPVTTKTSSTNETSTPLPDPKKSHSLIPSRNLKCTHKDKNNANKTLVLTNEEFSKRKLYFCGGELSVSLPKVPKNCKWWMIYLNSDFTYLSFVQSQYSIKYTDLMDVAKMSNNTRSTIVLRNTEFTCFYRHPLFGIFCVPEYQDRLFIGPYSQTETHDIGTLRYMRGRLIDTKLFNTMVGRKENNKKPMWVQEIPVKVSTGLVIDITEEEGEVMVVDSDSDEEKGSDSLLCAPFVEVLKADELKSRSINRYIVTNIPHLGYFGACQCDSRAIEVFWPGGSVGYRFPNVTIAKNLLIHYLTQVFCPIPQEFKINVIIMTHIDTQTNTQVDAKYFSGDVPYFCGEFGVCDKHNLPNELLTKHNIESVDSLLKWHRGNEEREDAMTRIFGLFLMSNEELRKHSDPKSILQWAVSEIYILKKLAENYESEKFDLHSMIRKNSQTAKETPKSQTTETIEITDSDEENVEKAGPAFKKIRISGKIDGKAVIIKKNERSLLKPKIWVKSGLMVEGGDKDKPSGDVPVKISLNNANIVLDKNKMLIAKLK